MKSVEHIPNIGDPCNYPANHPSYQTQKLDNMTCSMLRLIDYCDKRPNTSRKFLDGLIDVIKEEVKTRRFDILKAPRRKTIIRRVKKKYGHDTKGHDTGPVIRWMRLTSWQDPYRVTVPNEIDTRERDMICVIHFNLVKNIKDQLSM
jgi:predicted MPP superfamily phosphohydrolase